MAPWAGGFVLLAAPAMAQSGSGQASPAAPPVAESDAASIGEIVVTAQKRAQAINDVGMSINAISGDALASQRLISTADQIGRAHVCPVTNAHLVCRLLLEKKK